MNTGPLKVDQKWKKEITWIIKFAFFTLIARTKFAQELITQNIYDFVRVTNWTKLFQDVF